MDDGSEQTQQHNDAFARIWSEFASRMAGAPFAFQAGSASPEAMKQIRDAMLGAWSQYADEFMRSPQFLQAVKHSLDNAIAFRKQMNALLTRTIHEMQGVAREDVDGIFRAIEDLQNRLMERMDELSERLDRLESKRDSKHERSDGPAHPGQPASSQPASTRSSPRKKPKK